MGARAAGLGPISAVVCNYNGEHYLRACLSALLASELELDEIIVVDNGSTDASVALVRAEFPGARLLILPSNGGPCVARNAGMRAARNRWVLAVDNDAMIQPDMLGKLVAAAEAREEVVAVQPRSVYADETTRIHYDGGAFHFVGLYSLRNFAVPLTEAVGEGVLEVDGLIAICILFDRDAFEKVGGYDEDFFILFEDFDLSMRLRIAGHSLVSVEDALVLHSGGTPGISFRGDEYPKFRAYYHSRNRWILLYKNYSGRALLAALPGIMLYELVWGLFTLRSGHLVAHLAGKLDFLRCLGRMRPKRRRVQAQRRLGDRALLVGGPVTFSPQLVAKPTSARLASCLDSCLKTLWRMTGWIAP
ncbi:MAG: glycosyltransferase family 2 protein [Planctomycetota bacterium]|nr:glycosyltransferase family 2 protein [Planctomycetota bacterium]